MEEDRHIVAVVHLGIAVLGAAAAAALMPLQPERRAEPSYGSHTQRLKLDR